MGCIVPGVTKSRTQLNNFHFKLLGLGCSAPPEGFLSRKLGFSLWNVKPSFASLLSMF